MTVPKVLLPMKLQFFAEPEEAKVEQVEEKQPETVEEPTVENTDEKVSTENPQATNSEPVVPAAELEAMKQKLAELEASKAELESKITEKDNEVSASTAKVTDYEAALSKIVDQRLSVIPETITALMPDNLSVAEKLTWVEKAEVAIPAKEEKAEEPKQPAIETIGQPTPVTTAVEVDMKDLTASQKLNNYFQDFFGK